MFRYKRFTTMNYPNVTLFYLIHHTPFVYVETLLKYPQPNTCDNTITNTLSSVIASRGNTCLVLMAYSSIYYTCLCK